MLHHNDEPCPTGSATSDLDPVVTALREQDTFDRAQLAWLMNEAYRWGYEARVDEENTAYPPTGVFASGQHYRELDRKKYRDECDAAARLPRPGDFRGVAADDQRAAA